MASVGPTPCSGLKSDIASPIPKAHFGSLAALKRDFNITEIEGVSTRIITEALASAVEQSAYVWYARENLNAVPVPVEARTVADQINDPDSKRKMPNSCRGWRPLLARRQRQVCSHSAAGRFDGSWLSDIAHDPLAFVEGAFPSGEGELANFDGPMESQAWVLTQIRDGLLTPGKAIQTCWITLWAMTTAGNTRGIITSSSDDKSVCKVYWHT
jgi:hypothetical protein